MKKVLILGASTLQLPMIIEAKKIGYYVIVVDYDKNAIGQSYADIFYPVSTNDYEAVYKIACKENIDGITTIATDFPMRVVGKICDKLHLPGISEEIAYRATDKGIMANYFEKAGVPHPWYKVISSEEDIHQVSSTLSYPCICKPVDSSGSRGVSLVSSEDALGNAIQYALSYSKCGRVILEEVLEGQEISVEVFVNGGSIHAIALTDKITSGAPHYVEVGHSQPSKYKRNKSIYNRIVEVVKQSVKSLGIRVGAAHVEIMVTDRGPVVIEIGAHLGGDYIASDLTPLSTGVNMIANTLRQACGDEVSISPVSQKASAIRYLTPQKGRIRRMEGIREAKAIKGVVRLELLKTINDSVSDITSSSDRTGYVIACSDTVEEAVSSCNEAIGRIGIEVD